MASPVFQPRTFGVAAGRSSHIDRTDIARRMERVAQQGDAAGDWPDRLGDMEIDNTSTLNQRWTIDARWVTFECGCVAERCVFLFGARPSDPVIFRNLPQQAVYAECCDFHLPSMNVYCSFGRPWSVKGTSAPASWGFKEWKANRRNVLMGRTRA